MSRILNGSRFLLGDILALDGWLGLMQANRLMNRTLRYLLFFFCGVVACVFLRIFFFENCCCEGREAVLWITLYEIA